MSKEKPQEQKKNLIDIRTSMRGLRNYRRSEDGSCASYLHEGLHFTSFGRDGNPTMQALMFLTSDADDPTMGNDPNFSMFAYEWIMPGTTKFTISFQMNASRLMYNYSVPKKDLLYKVRYSRVGRTSFQVVGEFFLPNNPEPVLQYIHNIANIDLTTRRPKPFPQDLRDMATQAIGATSGNNKPSGMMERMEKIDRPQDTFMYRVCVVYSDSDQNQHCNFASYAKFAEDAINAAVRMKYQKKKNFATTTTSVVADHHTHHNPTTIANTSTSSSLVSMGSYNSTSTNSTKSNPQSSSISDNNNNNYSSSSSSSSDNNSNNQQNQNQMPPSFAISSSSRNNDNHNNTNNNDINSSYNTNNTTRKGVVHTETDTDMKFNTSSNGISSTSFSQFPNSGNFSSTETDTLRSSSTTNSSNFFPYSGNPSTALPTITAVDVLSGVKEFRIIYLKESLEDDILTVHIWQQQQDYQAGKVKDNRTVFVSVERGEDVVTQLSLEYFGVHAHL